MSTSPAIIDIDALLQPVSDEAPHGADPREDRGTSALYGRIKDARNGARAAERAALFDSDAGSEVLSQWRPVLDLSPKLIAGQGKDLEVACWYTEALIRFHGSTGLRDGFQLIDALVEKYWDNLFPEPDEDGLETKVAPLTGLNGDGGEGTLLAPIRNLTLTDEGEYTYWQYQQAFDADKLADADARAERQGRLGFSLADIRQAVQMGQESFYRTLIDDLDATLATFKQLQARLRGYCGNEAPPSSSIANTLEEVLRALRFLTKDKLVEAQAEAPETAAASAAPVAAGVAVAAVAGTTGPIASRDDALRRLHEVAQFFRATEPHTPIASGIERIVRWGRMSVAELMVELVPDANARAIYTQLTGVQIGASGNDSAPAYVPPPPVVATKPAPAPAAVSDDGW